MLLVKTSLFKHVVLDPSIKSQSGLATTSFAWFYHDSTIEKVYTQFTQADSYSGFSSKLSSKLFPLQVTHTSPIIHTHCRRTFQTDIVYRFQVSQLDVTFFLCEENWLRPQQVSFPNIHEILDHLVCSMSTGRKWTYSIAV